MPRVCAALVRLVACLGPGLGCAEQHPREHVKDDGAASSVADASLGEPAPATRVPDGLDATRCDDRGIDYVIDDLILNGALVPGDPCSVRFQKPLRAFEPWRLAVLVDGSRITPDFAQTEHAPDYSIDGDVIRITGPVCARLQSDGGRLHSISLRYGACRIWE